jgi:hypothetical protein
MELSIASLGASDQQLGDLHEIVSENRGAHKQFDLLSTLGQATFHAAAAHQYRDAAPYASAKRWPSLNARDRS